MFVCMYVCIGLRVCCESLAELVWELCMYVCMCLLFNWSCMLIQTATWPHSYIYIHAHTYTCIDLFNMYIYIYTQVIYLELHANSDNNLASFSEQEDCADTATTGSIGFLIIFSLGLADLHV
jgi:hypothetical protein